MVGVNHHSMNDTNKFIILKTLATQDAVSRAELSAISGLSKMTITVLVSEFMDKGIVFESGELDSNGGRRAKLLRLRHEALLALAVSIDREAVQVGLVNLHGQILASERMPFEGLDTNEILMSSIFYLCDQVLAEPLGKFVWGIGVSCAGPLDIGEGMILNPPDFHDIHDLKIAEQLHARYHLPCFLQNDMCTAALAEAYYGNRNNFSDFLYIGISTGVGGGVVLNRRLYTGANGLAGTIGHCIVERNGIACPCGQKGCLEQYSSLAAIVRWAREQSGDSSLSWLRLVQGLEQGSPLSVQAVERMADYLYIAISNYQSAFDMEGVILGGELYGAKEALVTGVRRRLQDASLTWKLRRAIAVTGSSFSSNASLIGTAALVLENNMDTI